MISTEKGLSRGASLMMCGLMTTLSLVATIAGCGRLDEADQFRGGVTQHEDVAMAFPGADGQTSALTAGGVSETRGALLGETSEFYKLTRGITAVVNGGTVSVLALVRLITTYPPSSFDTDVAVWGPHTQPLSPNTWRLTVHRLAAGQFQYDFEAKPKTADDSGYLKILSGHHNVAGGMAQPRRVGVPAFGSGDFVVDWDAQQMLPEHDDNVGSAAFMYSRPSATDDISVSVAFTQVMDKDTGMRVDATYDYVAHPGNGGNFQFTMIKDAIPTTAALETMSVRSRWQETGAGRSDVKMQGGDLPAEATANECWDSNFGSVFMTNSYGDTAKAWGAETECVFTPAEYATL